MIPNYDSRECAYLCSRSNKVGRGYSCLGLWRAPVNDHARIVYTERPPRWEVAKFVASQVPSGWHPGLHALFPAIESRVLTWLQRP
jgi:hypothetical protein